MSEFSVTQLGHAIRQVVGEPEGALPLHVPCFGPTASKYVQECVDTGWVSSVGKFVDRFEDQLAEFTGAERAVAVVNGTSGIHIALLLAGVTAGDEVLVPSLTFVATCNAITYCNATPHFVDVEETTLGIDATAIEDYLNEIAEVSSAGCINKVTGRRIHALLGVHAFGHPFNMPAVLELCEKYKLTLVEDAAESIGSYYDGQHTGTFGRLGVISFNGNKTISTGGGGAILTNSQELADRAKHLTTTGKLPHPYRYEHDVVAYNYRLTNISAALGCSQLEDLPEILAYKRGIAQRYLDTCADAAGYQIFAEPPNCKSSYWLNTMILDDKLRPRQEEVIQQLHEQQIFVRPAWTPMHQLAIYQDSPRMPLPRTENLAQRIINLPSCPKLNAV